MQSILLGAYWGARAESREEAAKKVSKFMRITTTTNPVFSRWFKLGKSRKKASSEIDLSEESVFKLLSTNNRDTDRTPIVELGFGFHAWNGSSSSVAIYIGAYEPRIPNSLLLTVDESISESEWRRLSEISISIFDPDDLVVTSHDYMKKHGDGTPIEVGGLFTYKRGSVLTRHEVEL